VEGGRRKVNGERYIRAGEEILSIYPSRRPIDHIPFTLHHMPS